MRFDKINIPAFGPFTHFNIDFDKAPHDLHLIYGANEAGKSSLLRGIHQMFYGIPGQSKDNFIHDYKALRIGGTISDSKNQLSFLRKKGHHNTLLDTDGNSIDDSELDAYLGSVNGEFFDSMFGLNTQSLRDGAAALLSGEGDLGTQLFSASLGGTPIETAISTLENEANGLYKGSAKVGKTILPALAIYKEGEKLAKSSATKVTAWNALLKDIKTAQQAFTASDTQLSYNQNRSLQLTNLTSALPTYTKFLQLSDALDSNTAPSVSSDFVQRYRSSLASYKDVSRTLQAQKLNIEEQQKQLERIPESAAALQFTADIETLTDGYETYLANCEAVDHLQREVAQLEATLQLYSEQLELRSVDEITQLSTISETTHSQFKQLSQSLSKQNHQRELAQAELAEIDSNITQHQDDLQCFSNSNDTSAIEELVQRCETHQAGVAQHEERAERIHSLLRNKETLTALLGLDTQEGNISAISLPSEQTIQQELQRENDLISKVAAHQQKIEEHDDSLATELAQLERLKKHAAIHSHSDLEKAREERDQQLKELSATAASKNNISPASFIKLTAATLAADDIADVLHSNAENIAKAENHLVSIENFTLKKQNTLRHKQESSAELEKWNSAWNKRFDALPISAQSPSDLLQWRNQWQELCSTIEELATLQHKSQKHSADQAELVQQIQEALHINHDGFRSLFSQLKAELKASTRGQGKLEAAQTALAAAKLKKAQATKNFDSAEKALSETLNSWQQLCSDSDLAEDIHPDQALDLIDKRSLAQQKSIDLKILSKELSAKSAAILSYNEQAAQLSQSLLDNAPSAASSSIPQLKQLITQAQQWQTQANTILQSIASEQKKLPELQLMSKEFSAELLRFQQQAEADSPESMERAIIQIETKAKLSDSLESQKDTLLQLAKGEDLETFFDRLKGLDNEQISEELADLEAQTEPFKEQRDRDRKALDALQHQQQELQQASDAAAAHKQDAANALSSIVTDTERFIKLQHAIHFLRDQVEAFRKKTQGPMMEKTSHYFSALTSGRYSGVAAQLDDKGKPQLVALRSNSDNNKSTETTTEVHTNSLSEGTADQLYLALRLAAIDLHLDKHPAIPLILDDLLMTFDDDRTRALLPVLAELSKKTQVLIFTHHSHLSQLATETTPELQQHKLTA